MKHKKIIAVILSLIYPIFINQGIVLAEDMKTAIPEITEKDKKENISEITEEKTTENDNIETTSGEEENIATTNDKTIDKSVKKNSLDQTQEETLSEEPAQEKSSENNSEEVNISEQKTDNNTNNTETTENIQNKNETTNEDQKTSVSENNTQVSNTETEEIIKKSEESNIEATEENKTNLENEEQNTTVSEEKTNSQEINSDNQEEISEKSDTKNIIEEPKTEASKIEKSEEIITKETSTSEKSQSSEVNESDNIGSESTSNEEVKTEENIVKNSSPTLEVEKSVLSEPTPVVKTIEVENPSESQNTPETSPEASSNSEIILTPTIRSKSSGGYWNNANTWVEGRIPTENDIVEINGTVHVTNGTLLGDIVIQEGATLKRPSCSRRCSDYYGTITGNVVNNGTMGGTGSRESRLTLTIDGTVENNGTILAGSFNFKGDITNNGTINPTTKTYGNIVNNGTWNGAVNLTWNTIPEANSYQIKITGYNPIISNTNSYRISSSIIQDTNNKFYWYVRGVKSDGTYTDYTNTQCINDESCLGGGNTNIPTIPTNLKQTYKGPEIIENIQIKPGEKIGKAQSGNGLILSADIQDNTKLNFEVYKDYQVGQSNTPIFSGNTELGINNITVPYKGAGEYNWRVRSESEQGKFSDWVGFGENTTGEVDFSLFEGFEPYPYGYSFPNRIIADEVLTGTGQDKRGVITRWFSNSTSIFDWDVKDGTRWDIFKKAFDIKLFDNDVEMLRAFEKIGANKDRVFKIGNCYGMALSAAIGYKYKDFFNTDFSDFATKIQNGNIWNNIEKLEEIDTDNGKAWSKYNKILETILAFQVSQKSIDAENAKKNGVRDIQKIIDELKKKSNKVYVLSYGGINKVNKGVGHTVVPYKVEENLNIVKIFVRDNNFPYTSSGEYNLYNQYIIINKNNEGEIISWSNNPAYERKSHSRMSLIDIDVLKNKWKTSLPRGFGETDQSIKLDGNSDIIIIDTEGRKSGFQNGQILEEIPGIEVIRPVGDNLNSNLEIPWKEIYLPENQEGLTIKVSGDITESYDLTVAGGNSYTKIESVETTDGQVDTFNITKNNIKMDFDDSKTGEYNILVDYFYNNGTGEVYETDMESEIKPQQYNIDWISIYNNFNGVTYGIDKNLDGIYEDYTNLLPTFSPSVLMTSPSLHMESISPEKSLENKKGK